METIETFNTWKGLLYLTLGLLILYWFIKALLLVTQRFSRRSLWTKRLINVLKYTLLLFKPVAFLVIILDFIAINYVVHGIFLAIVGAFAYRPIRNYISGLLLRFNPIIAIGALIRIADLNGEVKRLLPLGLVVSTESGERFFGYTTVEDLGFTIGSNDTGLYRHTLYIKSAHSRDEILDLLFDNPVLNFNEPPSVRMGDFPDSLKLQYTLEEGASSEDLMAFFAQHEISTMLKQNT